MNMMGLTPQQRARAELRANFLYALCELSGEECNITTFEQTTLGGAFTGWKTDGAEIVVRSLQTPGGENMHTALIRTSDVISVEFSRNIVLPTRCRVKVGPCSGDLRGR